MALCLRRDEATRPRQVANHLHRRRRETAHGGCALRRPPLGRPRLVAGRVCHRAPKAEALSRAWQGGRPAASQVLLHRPRRLARLGKRAKGGRVHRHRALRLHLHRAGGHRRGLGRDLPPRDVRRDHDPRRHTHVSARPQDQGDGHQDGDVGRGGRRDAGGVPLLPQGAKRHRAARGVCAQGGGTPPVRLPPRQQGYDGARPGGARPLP
mmetsp:Transcript_4178/g.13171  ORF Transcript_4178/g.13171 Transcript_4178/m.13171 type:complete len:209 (+) Transcript_4178:753-1379(+)